MRTLFVLLLPLLLWPGSISAAGRGWTTVPFLQGTVFGSQYHVYDSGIKGPRVLIFAPHSDERSAGLFLNILVARYRVDKGFLVVCPMPVTPAWKAVRRQVIEDLNRQYGPDTDINNTPLDVIARCVRYWIRHYRIQYVLNMHEGWRQFRNGWKDYGEGFVIDDPSVVPLCRKVAARVNRRVRRAHRFLVQYKPMANTLTFYGFDKGLPSIGVEICRNFPIKLKVRYQQIAIEEFLREWGIRLLPIKP